VFCTVLFDGNAVDPAQALPKVHALVGRTGLVEQTGAEHLATEPDADESVLNLESGQQRSFCTSRL